MEWNCILSLASNLVFLFHILQVYKIQNYQQLIQHKENERFEGKLN